MSIPRKNPKQGAKLQIPEEKPLLIKRELMFNLSSGCY
jgi:hypothetical protein